MRGATLYPCLLTEYHNISIHAPRERSDDGRKGGWFYEDISIHAPRERSDRRAEEDAEAGSYFNPRSSWEERLSLQKQSLKMPYFNPRSSWEERHQAQHLQSSVRYFNPRSSWEERRCHERCGYNRYKFQSTLLVRGATDIEVDNPLDISISIHAPRERSDSNSNTNVSMMGISIHAPRERSDGQRISPILTGWEFQSTLLVRGATHFVSNSLYGARHFNPRSSWEERLLPSRYVMQF